ncbi:hypothetical protein [Runella slithyformis]|uniref:Uncharacterized protein n=1 Tax=Runella slithyformis (strain ATCC 29530 / DSM 19594 / LMG 11500 / NCIMB 11436 / LSU 4) TaxID=761193 RepID=A0A7U4E7F2_RUNSL|nr:hypothetical protein [Runella slithyformis]AEI50248.1 hypothetical protein Runsl_3892 [Runella slithyformis DSM 19594]
MTVPQFTQAIDGIVNDFTNAITNNLEFRNAICDLLIEIARPALADNDADDYAQIYEYLTHESEKETFCKAILAVASEILHDKHGQIHTANEIHQLLVEEYAEY